MRKKITLALPHGTVVCQYYEVEDMQSPLVVLTNGRNGFYSRGMWPSIQEVLLRNDISSVAYNFSHGGVEDGLDYFTRLDLYEKNCMRLEVEDLYGIIECVRRSSSVFHRNDGLFLMGHSLGGVPTIFCAKKASESGVNISGIILLASLSSLKLNSAEKMKEWGDNGVLWVKDDITNQVLPRGRELYTEVRDSDTVWNLRSVMGFIDTRYLIIHGDKDEYVKIEHSESLRDWAVAFRKEVTFYVIKNGSHFFNTKHPFEGESVEFKEVMSIVADWVHLNS